MMQTKNIAMGLFLLLAAGASSARADSLEFMGGSTGGVNLHSVENNDTETTIGLSIGLGYFVTPQFEGFVEGTYSHYSSGGSSSSHSLAWIVGPRFNFGGAPENAFYVGGGLGEGQPSGSTNHTFSWQLHAGKRFALFPNVSWAPEVQYVRVNGQSGYSYKEPHADWNIIPFRISILL
ncbi:MAG: outer membrane beta-barrel protein [Bdellovibrionales bacterium]|nr:outer membrane beta-barrel protein [Bdellovibrionales bacterium]